MSGSILYNICMLGNVRLDFGSDIPGTTWLPKEGRHPSNAEIWADPLEIWKKSQRSERYAP